MHGQNINTKISEVVKKDGIEPSHCVGLGVSASASMTSFDQPAKVTVLAHELAAMCETMEYLRSWFGAHETLLQGVPGANVCRIYDRFVEGICRARTIAQKAGIKIDSARIKAHDWNARPFHQTGSVGSTASYRYERSDLGFTEGTPTIVFLDEDDTFKDCSVEFALWEIDNFAEPGRTRLIIDVALHFGLPTDALMGSAEKPAAPRQGAAQ